MVLPVPGGIHGVVNALSKAVKGETAVAVEGGNVQEPATVNQHFQRQRRGVATCHSHKQRSTNKAESAGKWTIVIGFEFCCAALNAAHLQLCC